MRAHQGRHQMGRQRLGQKGVRRHVQQGGSRGVRELELGRNQVRRVGRCVQQLLCQLLAVCFPFLPYAAKQNVVLEQK